MHGIVKLIKLLNIVPIASKDILRKFKTYQEYNNNCNSNWDNITEEEWEKWEKEDKELLEFFDTLIELGLIEFVALLKKKDFKRERLFQELKHKGGGYTQNVSRWWNQRYLPSLGLKTDKKNFHSFRHTVIDHLKQKGIEPHFINVLLGHGQKNIDLDRYGNGYNPSILFNKCVKKISYQTSHKRWIDFKMMTVKR